MKNNPNVFFKLFSNLRNLSFRIDISKNGFVSLSNTNKDTMPINYPVYFSFPICFLRFPRSSITSSSFSISFSFSSRVLFKSIASTAGRWEDFFSVATLHINSSKSFCNWSDSFSRLPFIDLVVFISRSNLSFDFSTSDFCFSFFFASWSGLCFVLAPRTAFRLPQMFLVLHL